MILHHVIIQMGGGKSATHVRHEICGGKTYRLLTEGDNRPQNALKYGHSDVGSGKCK